MKKIFYCLLFCVSLTSCNDLTVVTVENANVNVKADLFLDFDKDLMEEIKYEN